MTPGARAAAAIALLEELAGGGPADRRARAFFRTRRYVGARDRAAISGHVYAVLRRRAQLDWWLARAGLAVSARTRLIAALLLVEDWSAARLDEAFGGGRFEAAPLSAAERACARELAGRPLDCAEQPEAVRANLPVWLHAALARRFGADTPAELAALGAEAPVDLRVNELRGDPAAARRALAEAGIEATPTPRAPAGLRIAARTPLGATRALREGLVEVQDEGSQLAAALAEARPGQRVCDFCAGAGGKTLALSAAMHGKGRIVACDTASRRLERAMQRLRRAGASNVEPRVLSGERDAWVKRHRESFDRVLVDAPCSGSGTWRRNPDARWRLDPAQLSELAAKQARILDSAARLVRPGGRLVYVTCSLLLEEDEEQAAAFLARHPDFSAMPVAEVWDRVLPGACPSEASALLLTPLRHGTDGFFVALFERAATAGAGPGQARPQRERAPGAAGRARS